MATWDGVCMGCQSVNEMQSFYTPHYLLLSYMDAILWVSR